MLWHLLSNDYELEPGAMNVRKLVFFVLFIAIEGFLLASFFSLEAFADTIVLKNGKNLKGLVVEKHADRIFLSTEKGEIPILLSGIKDIQYDTAEQNFFKAGKAYEAENKLGPALAFYEKALEENPNFEEAKVAALGVRNRFWASSTEGPINEVEKQQAVYDAWQRGTAIEDVIAKKAKEQAALLKERLGITLEKKGDWIRLANVESAKPAALAGLKRYDRLVSMDGESLRYLNLESVEKLLLLPRYSNFNLEFDRDCLLNKGGWSGNIKGLGFQLKLRYQGLVVDSVDEKRAAYAAGIKNEDLLTHVNANSTRYMPLKDVPRLMEDPKEEKMVLTIRRSALLARG